MGQAETFPELLLANAEHFAQRVAIREKEYGIWQAYSWANCLTQVQDFANGLAALGFKRGNTLAIIGDNRPTLYWSIAAAQSLGGVPVPTYQDAVAEEMQYVLEHAEARFVVAENQEQVDKILEIKLQCPNIEAVIYDDSRGMRHYQHAFLYSFADIQRKGQEFAQQNPSYFRREIAKGRPEDTAIILYTSGTTGRPKGVVLSHQNVLLTAKSGCDLEQLTEREETLAYLPMAWIGDHVFSYAQSYVSGFCVSCPESAATVMTDLREIGPTYFFAPPRIFENLLTRVMIRIEDASWLKRKMFHYFMAHARQVGSKILDGIAVSGWAKTKYQIGKWLIYEPLKNTLGLSRIRVAYTAGEAIGPEIFEFYRSLGINIKQLYGQTESSVFIAIQPNGEVRADTVGKPAPGVEVKITEDGEVMYRSPGVFVEYFKSPEATAATKTPDGWVHTGDAGYFDSSGHLHIIDRAKDVGKLEGGAMFAPKYLENKLKFFPHIKEAVAFGHARKHSTALINIDLEAVGNWAERRGIPYASYQELAARQEVYDLIADNIREVNRDLSSDPKLADSQIKRFLILHKELDADDGELTRTQKVRRGFIAQRYQSLVDALYSESHSCFIETEVAFEDGRKGTISADVQIRPIETFVSDLGN